MTYLWNEFNIKTFAAETIVFRDGIFMENLSDFQSGKWKAESGNTEINIDVDKMGDLPIHIIYVGEISGDHELKINIFSTTDHRPPSGDHRIFLTTKIQNKMPAFLNIYVKNTGEKSFFRGKILAQNYSEFDIETTGLHGAPDTGIILETKVVAHSKSKTKLTGIAKIEKNCINCESDVGFTALAAPDATIEFAPKQLIAAAPQSAEHSASLYKGTSHQVIYLREAGLGATEIKAVLEEAFISE